MIQFYPKYKQFKAWVDAKDYENAVRSGAFLKGKEGFCPLQGEPKGS